jgi:hypothetical protein
VTPRGEARADIDIVFDLAVRLGLGSQFWHGDVAAVLDHHLAPSGLSLEALRASPHGIRVPLKTRYKKYRDVGFATPSGKIEIFSTVLPTIGEPPLPEFRAPFAEALGFPLTLTSAARAEASRNSIRIAEQYRSVREHLMDRWWDAAEVLCTQFEPRLNEPFDDELMDELVNVLVLVRLDRLLQCDCEAERCDCGLTLAQRGLIAQLKATEREIEVLGGGIAR